MEEQRSAEEQREHAADQLLAEYLRLVESGATVDREEFLRQHPDSAEILRAYFKGAESVQRMIAEDGRGEVSTRPVPEMAQAQSARSDETIAPRGFDDSTSTAAGPFAVLPKLFGRYRVEKLLGRGSMGAVYLAHDAQLSRPVALKVPRLSGHEDSDVINRLLREAKAAANLNHPNICRVYDTGLEDGIFYIAMEYVDGRLLSDFISPDRVQDERRSVNVVRKLATALADAHAKGIIHRDLKPGNILVNARGEPILTDFGLARLTGQPAESRATQAGMLIGSPAYMSPEQANAESDKIGPRSDIYSLGVLLFELLTSRLPFQGSVLTILSQITTKEPPAPSSLRPGLDPRLDFLCQRMMAKRPEDRFASMTEVARELQSWLKAAPLIVTPEVVAKDSAPALQHTGTARGTALADGLLTPADVTNQERRAQKLLDEQNFDAAIPLLVKMAGLQATLFQATSAWAAAQLPVAKQKQLKLCERVQAAGEKARALLKTYNYAEAAELLESLPGPALTEETRRLLSEAVEKSDESLGLKQEIDEAVKAKNYDRLLPLVRRFLKLKPDNAKMQRLAAHLARNRPERAVRNYKKTGTYLDVAGRLVDPIEIVLGLGFIAVLAFGVYYGVQQYRQQIPEQIGFVPSISPGGEAKDRRQPASNRPFTATSEIAGANVATEVKGVPFSSRWPAAFRRQISAGSERRFLSVFDRQTGVVFWDSVRDLRQGWTLPPRPDSQLLCLQVSPDERLVVTAVRDTGSRSTRLQVWDLAGGGIRQTFEPHSLEVYQLAWHPSGQRFASGAVDGSIRIWDLERNTPFPWSPRLEHARGISGLTFHPRYNVLVSSSYDGNFKFWKLPDDQDSAGNPVSSTHTQAGGPHGPSAAAYSPTGEQLIVAGDGAVHIWEPAEKIHIRYSVPGTAFAWSPDGKSFATAGGLGMETEARRWDSEKGTMITRFRGSSGEAMTAVAFSPTAKVLLTDGSEDGFLAWDVESGSQISDLGAALKSGWGKVAGDSREPAPPAGLVPVDKLVRDTNSRADRPARVAVVQCVPFSIVETGLWIDAPEWLRDATVYEPPLAGKAQFRNVVEFEVLEGGTLALAVAWNAEPHHPAASINDKDTVTEEQLTQRGWVPVDTITRPYAGGVRDGQRIFLRRVETGEKFRLATRNLTPPFVIIPDIRGAALMSSRVSSLTQKTGNASVETPTATADKNNRSQAGFSGLGGDRLDSAWRIVHAGSATDWKFVLKNDRLQVNSIAGTTGYAIVRVSRPVVLNGDFQAKIGFSWKSQPGVKAANAAMQGLMLNFRDSRGNIVAGCGFIDENVDNFGSPISVVSTETANVGPDPIEFHMKRFNQAVPPSPRQQTLPASGSATATIRRFRGEITAKFDSGKVQESISGENVASIASVEIEFRRYVLDPNLTFTGASVEEIGLTAE